MEFSQMDMAPGRIARHSTCAKSPRLRRSWCLVLLHRFYESGQPNLDEPLYKPLLSMGHRRAFPTTPLLRVLRPRHTVHPEHKKSSGITRSPNLSQTQIPHLSYITTAREKGW
jgi:hypothetical protein